jgi:hypothetical protein
MSKRTILIAVPLVAVVAVVAFLVFGGGDDDKAESTKPAFAGGIVVEAENAYRFTYPKATWEPVGKVNAAQTTIRRRDKSGLIVVRQRGKLEGEQSREAISDVLTTQLKKQYKDFRFVRSSELELPAGKAISYTFLREKSNRVQGVVVLPKGDHTFTLNSVVTGNAQNTAREVRQIINTFDPEN